MLYREGDTAQELDYNEFVPVAVVQTTQYVLSMPMRLYPTDRAIDYMACVEAFTDFRHNVYA